jgi:sugar phosphate isomerase/epimerase
MEAGINPEKSGDKLLDVALHRLDALAAACSRLDTRIVTLSTGSLGTFSTWEWNSGNRTRRARERVVRTMRRVVQIANRHEVTMAFEPEIHNVVNSVFKARRLLDEVGSPWLKVVIDPANLIEPDRLSQQQEILDEAFDWLGGDIVLAHAKELATDGHTGDVAPGDGVLDYGRYFNLLEQAGFNGPIIVHGLPEDRVGRGVEFLRRMLGRNLME